MVRAGEPESKGQIDEISKTALDAFVKMSYSAGALGAKQASATCVGSMEHMMGKMDAKGSYVWDGKKGKTSWNNAMLAQGFDQQGFDAGTIDGIFDAHAFDKVLAGLTLVGTKTATGVDVVITGKSAAGFKGLKFNTEGLLTTVSQAVDAPGMGTMTVDVTFTYEKKGDKQRMTGWVANVDLGPQGKLVDTTTITWTTVGGYDVFSKLASSAVMGGQPAGTKTFVLSDWKFNDDVKIEAAVDGCGKSRKADDGCDDGCEEGDDDDGCEEDDDEDEGCDDDDGCDD